MKNFIKYFYNIDINEIRNSNIRNTIKTDNANYEFNLYEGDLYSLYNIYLILKNNNILCHDIIFNKDNSIVSIYKDKPYILLRKNINTKEKANIEEIFTFSKRVNTNHKLNWKKLWQEKNDYYEEKTYNISNKIIADSFEYYLGLGETAISLLNYVDYNLIEYYIQHKRISTKKDDDFYSPANIIIDTKVRDIGNFIKTNYLDEFINIDDTKEIINRSNLSNNEAILLFARLLYPSIYYDLCDEILYNDLNNDKLLKYIKKNESYESFLRQIYNYLKGIYRFPEIEWLEIK